jgi:signal transduction histidine kinase
MNLLMMLLAMPGLLLALTAVYSHARQPKGAMYGFVFLCLLLTYPTARWPYYWGWLMVYVCLTAAVADAIRVCVLAKRRRIAGAGIILIGWIVFFFSTGFSLLMILGAIKLTDLGPNYSHILDLTYNAGFLFLWLPFSIILAREFAKTNRSLQHRLKEVEALSAKTVEQEKEKQQILADQNIKLEQQVEQRTTELKHSLQELKATQTQLIQSEKMASLGELTAGIAHEIQNPLNFVNNFSEINADLIDEMKETLQSGNTNDALSVAEEIKENNLKITSHGKRADAIVKGMLQHSRTSTGQKEHTDINTLMDEYLRLSYHGFRAKDKSFNASIQTHFDESLGKINLVPQEIGRVLLNLFNNAFYAVQEKKKTSGEGYEPMVYVSTKRHMDKVEISVQDNGMGILKSVQDKIFQPFFTTKPTGEGTGLGLSLSYDIVKAHGGELKVESTEGEGSEFIVILYQDLS